MLKLIIEDDEGRKTVVPFVRDEITIGRQEGNTIRLTERNVSRRHARLLRNNGSVQVEDLGSYNGIRLNGEKVSGRVSVNDGDLIQIGDYDLAIQHEGTDQPVNAPAPPLEATQPGTPPPLSRPTVQMPVLGATEEVHTEASSAVFEEAEPLPESEEETAADAAPVADGAEAPRRQSTAIIRADQVEASRNRPVLELDAEEAPRLVVLNTEFAGREFACIRTELRIGREEENDISLDHRSLSRTHAKLVRETSGEWRIIDMQSANGLRVNGETYAQSTVAHLDTIELGHLKLKFVGAGEPFTFVPGADAGTAGRRGAKSKAPVFITVGVLLIGGGAAGAWFYGPQLGLSGIVKGGSATILPVDADTPRPLTPPEPVKQPVPSAARAQPVPEAPVEDPATAEARQKLSIARGAIAQAQLTRAIDVLVSIKKLRNVQQPVLDETQSLLEKARGEQIMKERLDQAAAALKRARLDQARKLLAQSSATEVFADRHEALTRELTARTDSAAGRRKAQSQVALARARTEKQERATDTVPVDATESAPEQPTASKLFEDGKRLLEKRQTREARSVLLQCVEMNPRYSRCHLLLGAAYAKLGDAASGAKHYELFLKLDPDAQEAGTVRMMLEQYRESRKGNN